MSEQATAPTTEASTPAAPPDAGAAVQSHYDSARSDAVKAVEAAFAAEAAKAPAKPAEDPEAPDEPATAVPEEATEEAEAEGAPVEAAPAKKNIAEILKNRTQRATETEAQKLSRERAEFQKEMEQARVEREEIAREKAKLAKLKDIRNAPEALKEIGWDAEEFVATAARANTPEGRLEAMVRQQAEVIRKLEEKATGWEKQAEEQQRTAQEQARVQGIKQTEDAFIKTALEAEKFPSLATFYGDEEDREILLQQAHGVAYRYREATGDNLTFDEIAAYLEEKVAKKLGAQKQATPTKGKAPTAGRPPGKRSISSADSSERRSMPSVERIDDEDERRRRAIQAAEKAMRESA